MSTRRNRPVEITDAIVKRSIPIGRLELRETDETDNEYVLSGYASTFQEYDMYGGPANYGWIERIDPGAFDKTLREKPDLHLLLNHDGAPLARTKSGTLSLSVDNHGLKVEARLDKRDPEAQSLAVKMQRGDLDEMSFAFRVKAQEWRAADGFEDDDQSYRTITEVSLHKGDVSVVNWGANPTTSAGIRSASDALRYLADCDESELVEARADDDVLRRAKEKLGIRPSVHIENMCVAESTEEERDVSVTVNIEVTDDDEAEDSTESDEALSADSDAEERSGVTIDVTPTFNIDAFVESLRAALATPVIGDRLARALDISDDERSKIEEMVPMGAIEGLPTGTLLDGVFRNAQSAIDNLTEAISAITLAQAEAPKKGMSLRLALALGDE